MTPAEVTPIQKHLVVPRRVTILPKRALQQPAISTTSWILLAVTLAIAGAIFYFSYGRVLRAPLRWTVTTLWVLVTVGLGLYDFVAHTPGSGQGTDSTPWDRWTFSHAGAGLVFGVWYLPVWAAAALTVGWEIFEINVTGFGDKEIFKNRAVDVGIALFGWLLVVVVAMSTAVPYPQFPFLTAVAR